MNISILYLLLAFLCIYLVLSQLTDDKYITKMLIALMPSAEKSGLFS